MVTIMPDQAQPPTPLFHVAVHPPYHSPVLKALSAGQQQGAKTDRRFSRFSTGMDEVIVRFTDVWLAMASRIIARVLAWWPAFARVSRAPADPCDGCDGWLAGRLPFALQRCRGFRMTQPVLEVCNLLTHVRSIERRSRL